MLPGVFYSLTYRQFSNMLNGYQKEKDTESKERLIIMRNIMFASMAPHSKNIKKPTDVLEFDFEKEVVQKMSNVEYSDFVKEIERVKAFYAN